MIPGRVRYVNADQVNLIRLAFLVPVESGPGVSPAPNAAPPFFSRRGSISFPF